MNKKSKSDIVAETRSWLEKLVIGLQLCPFAKVPYDLGLVRIIVTRTDNMSEWIKVLFDEMHRLDQTPSDKISNTLVVFGNGLPSFEDFLDLIDMAQITLEDSRLQKTLQLAHFHPLYQFAELPADDPSHYTNRSPYPMLHLLRVDEVAAAIASHPDIDSVAPRNVKLMQDMGVEGIEQLLGSK